MDGWNAILIQKKTAVIFNIQEQIIETKTWEKLKSIGEVNILRLCGEQKEAFNTSYQGERS